MKIELTMLSWDSNDTDIFFGGRWKSTESETHKYQLYSVNLQKDRMSFQGIGALQESYKITTTGKFYRTFGKIIQKIELLNKEVNKTLDEL